MNVGPLRIVTGGPLYMQKIDWITNQSVILIIVLILVIYYIVAKSSSYVA